MPNTFDNGIDWSRVTDETSLSAEFFIQSERTRRAEIWGEGDAKQFITTLTSASMRLGFPLLLALESSIAVLHEKLSDQQDEQVLKDDITIDHNDPKEIAKGWGEDGADALLTKLINSSRRVDFDLNTAIEAALGLLRAKQAELLAFPQVSKPDVNQPSE